MMSSTITASPSRSPTPASTSTSTSTSISTSTSSTLSLASQVRVGVRIRPTTYKEQSDGAKTIVSSNTHHNTIDILERKFTFDSVYDEHVTQQDLYESITNDNRVGVGVSMLDAFLDGYNSTIMAYGQTGSGKTFSMGSEAEYLSGSNSVSVSVSGGNGSEEEGSLEINCHHGLIPRFMKDIFESLKRRKNESQSQAQIKAKGTDQNQQQQSELIDYKVSASFLEVYGEDIHDLLGEDSRQVLPLFDNARGEVVVGGLQEKSVRSAQDALRLLTEGTLNRTTAATLMNKKSSRSHAVFTIYLTQIHRTYNHNNRDDDTNDDAGGNGSGNGSMDVTTVSRFTFVDLAGSERMKKTGAEGERAREGIKINQGLLALGNVINALADDARLQKGEKVGHVPYRQSKLTRLLQDALGGNSQTLFLACVSPADTNASETASTLKYANRARNIKNAPTKNVDATVAELQRLYSLTQVLERELVRVKYGAKQLDSSSSTSPSSSASSGDNEGGNRIGEASDELYQREDVQEYLEQIRSIASEKNFVVPPVPVPSASGSCIPSTPMSAASNASSKITMAGSTSLPSLSSRGLTVSNTPLQGTNMGGKPPVSTSTSRNNRRQMLIENIDDNVLGINPDEDIALLDKLLELQHIDQEYTTESKQDQEKLKAVEGELEAQEDLLLQLKDNLKGYQNLKVRFEDMMLEIQGLEKEKTTLARELESVQVDPSKGCSKAIKRRLDDVVAKLARARSETRKNQQMYRKAEQEAQKARTLQQKIDALKQGRVALIKKQREATTKHRESTEAKSREIMVLKRNERKAGQKMTKLEAEVQKHKANLQKRKVFCDKMADKLKQTEAHLMRVLSIRKRQGANNNRKRLDKCKRDSLANGGNLNEGFAPHTEEISSLEFLIEKLVMDRVSVSLLKSSYETKVAEYSDLMREIVGEMKSLKEAKEKLRSSHDDEDTNDVEQTIADSSQTIEDLEFKLEVVEKDLDRIRTKLPGIDNPESDELEAKSTKFENDAMQMIANLSGPVVKTLLWDILDFSTNAEVAKSELREKLQRKEAALSSFEDEIQILNQRILHLTQDLDRRRSVGSLSTDSGSPASKDISEMKEKLNAVEDVNSKLSSSNKEYISKLEEKDSLLATMAEKVTVLRVTLANAGVEAKETVDKTLDELQEIWKIIGLPPEGREEARLKIEACLENSCSDALNEARKQERECENEIKNLRLSIKNMHQALGLESEFSQVQKEWTEKRSMFGHISILKQQEMHIIPTYSSAKDRRSNIISDVEAITQALELPVSELPLKLRDIMNKRSKFSRRKRLPLPPTSPLNPNASSKQRRATQFKQVEELVRALETPGSEKINDDLEEYASELNTVSEYEDEPNSLSDDHLSQCEADVKKLKLMRTDAKVSNQMIRAKAKDLTFDMHLRGRELLSLCIHSIKKRKSDLPSWWDPHVAEEVCRSIVSRDGIIRVNVTFTKHLESMYESLKSVSAGRRALSETLQNIVKTAHNTLLNTVEGEINVNEAYASFGAALQRLPPLSKENIYACIEEMKTLLTAVDAMAQSEVEALTVVWEALNVTNGDKGRFWGDIEDAKNDFQSQSHNFFDVVLKACSTDIEEWLLCSVKDAKKIQHTLSIGLLKLSKIHEEVERLSAKQSAKSKIMSLDSELCILNAKLLEFEEKANTKQRLTKKTNSSSLLREERFRKQMQGNFSDKLNNLRNLLSEWESIEGEKFDKKMLSGEVNKLLQNPEERTAFMHLKTIQQKTRRKMDTPRRKSPARRVPEKERSTVTKARPSNALVRPIHQSASRPISAESTIKNAKRATNSRSRPRSTMKVNGGGKTSPPRSTRSASTVSRSPGREVLKALQKGKLRVTQKSPVKKKTLSIQTNAPVLPFGQVLSQTPTEKENIRF